MPSPDTLATVALVAAGLWMALFTRFTAPGGLFRIPLIVRGVRYHHAGLGRHVKRPAEENENTAVWVIAPAAEEPTTDTVPWARPDVPATIPDALTNVRTPA